MNVNGFRNPHPAVRSRHHSVFTHALRAFTLIELLVVIAIIAILAAILFPVFAQARAKARQTVCLSNSKQIAMAIALYATDADETLPLFWYGIKGMAPVWQGRIYSYVKNVDAFYCPDSGVNVGNTNSAGGWNSNNRADHAINYYIAGRSCLQPKYSGGVWTESSIKGCNNYGPTTLADIDRTSDVIISGDTELYHFGPGNDNVPANFNWWTGPGSNGLNNSQANPTIDAPKPGNKQGWPAFRHMDGGIFYFADGHAKWIKRGNLRIWNFNYLASPQ